MSATRAGLPVAFLPTGAIVQRFEVAGQNIVLGFPATEPYRQAPYFGETIGRVANRIENGVINNLNGQSYQLAQNNPPNHSHGGNEGWGKKTFSGPHTTTRDGKECTEFRYISPDGDEGYPGTVELRVWYTVTIQESGATCKTVLTIEYEVELVGDECEETVVNLTNHRCVCNNVSETFTKISKSYLNISDSPTIEGTQCTLTSSEYLEVNDARIPTGQVVEHSGIQANKPFILGKSTPVVDNCFVMDKDGSNVRSDTRSQQPELLARFYHPATNIHVEIMSTEPAFQFYTGDLIDDIPATQETAAFGPRSGHCIEPCRYINAINVPAWRNQTLLRRGQLWGSKIIYTAWKA